LHRTEDTTILQVNNRYNSNSKIAEDKSSEKQKQEKTLENFNLVVDWFPSAMGCANL
jgi:hypothetical protein